MYLKEPYKRSYIHDFIRICNLAEAEIWNSARPLLGWGHLVNDPS